MIKAASLAAVLLLALASSAMATEAINPSCGSGSSLIPGTWKMQYKLDNSGQKDHIDVPIVTEGMTEEELDKRTIKLYTDQTLEFRTNWAVGSNSGFDIVFDPPLPGTDYDNWHVAKDNDRGTYTGSGSGMPAIIYTATVYSKTCKAGVQAKYRFAWASRLPGDYQWHYSEPAPKYTACVEIPTNSPPFAWAGLDVSYRLWNRDGHELPTGLVFDETYGDLNGISYYITDIDNDGVEDAINYKVTATNLYGETTTTNLPLIVKPTKPRALWYWLHKVIDVTRGRYMQDFYPKWKCSRPTKWTISPALPKGLKFEQKSGRIYGQPKVITNRIKYVVTGENNLGSANTIVRIRVWEAPSYLLKRLQWQPCKSVASC